MLYPLRLCSAVALALTLAACATSERSENGSGGSTASSGSSAEGSLALCPRLTVSNAPAADANGNVRGYKPTVRVNGVALLVNPAPSSCLSSAFGRRNGRLHKGLDFQSDPAGPVVAAGPGTVVESGYRDDYGQYVVVDHGSNVYTRYAHLASRAGAARVGGIVRMGTRLGVMGNTASYRIPIHLHYEVLVGNYATPAASFGLEPVDLFARM